MRKLRKNKRNASLRFEGGSKRNYGILGAALFAGGLTALGGISSSISASLSSSLSSSASASPSNSPSASVSSSPSTSASASASSSPSASASSSPSASASSSPSASPSAGSPGYDVFLIAGQSNTFYGEPFGGETLPDTSIDTVTDTDIKQLGRYDGENDTVIEAIEPLDSYEFYTNRVGWGLAFAKMWKANGYLATGRKVLLVHCGDGGTSFNDGHWTEGGVNYLDAVNRTNSAMGKGSDHNILQAVLWLQGETDADYGSAAAAAHKAHMLTLIDNFRTEFGDSSLPFVVGGMVPAYVSGKTDYETVQAGIIDVPNVRTYTGYADPETPTELTGNGVHYYARSNRGYSGIDYTDYTTTGMAGRFWVAYLASLNNT